MGRDGAGRLEGVLDMGVSAPIRSKKSDLPCYGWGYGYSVLRDGGGRLKRVLDIISMDVDTSA